MAKKTCRHHTLHCVFEKHAQFSEIRDMVQLPTYKLLEVNLLSKTLSLNFIKKHRIFLEEKIFKMSSYRILKTNRLKILSN